MTTTIEQKTYPCKIGDNWYAGLENAYLTITSPKGGYITISKWPLSRLKNHWDKNEDVKKLVWKVYGEAIENSGICNLTKEEMTLLYNYSDNQPSVNSVPSYRNSYSGQFNKSYKRRK